MEHTWSDEQQPILDWFAKSYGGQYEIYIDHNGNLVIRARAGTGKTTIMIAGAKRAPEKSILICAFAKPIQEELEKRFTIVQGSRKIRTHPHIKCQTIHSVGLGSVHRFRENIQVDFSPLRADLLASKVCGKEVPDVIRKQVAKLLTKGRELAPRAKDPGDLIEIAITYDCEPDDQWALSGFPLEFVEARALEAMELAADIKSGDSIDGSDMIFLPIRNGWLKPAYELVLIDEMQDMTRPKLEIAFGVLLPGGRICGVGDDCQAIFGFLGADSESLDRMKRDMNAGELGLTTTYRCGKAIVREAQYVVPDFRAHESNGEGEVLELNSSKLVEAAGPGDFIVSRVNAPLVSVAMKLLRAGKRTRILGKDIGKGLISLIRKFRGRSVPDLINKIEAWMNKEVTRHTVQLEEAKTESRKATIQAKIDGVRDQADMLISLTEGAKNVNEIEEKITALFEKDNLGTAGMITCSSVHKVKGLEADRVFVLQDTLRNYNQEEKNIGYVAITRAKKTLVMVSDNARID